MVEDEYLQKCVVAGKLEVIAVSRSEKDQQVPFLKLAEYVTPLGREV